MERFRNQKTIIFTAVICFKMITFRGKKSTTIEMIYNVTKLRDANGEQAPLL